MWRSNLFKFEKILHSRTWKRKGTLDASFMCGYNFLHTPFNLIWHNQEPSLRLKVLAFSWHFRKSGYMERIKNAANFLATFQDPVSLPNICFRLRFDFSHLLSQFSQLLFWKQWFNLIYKVCEVSQRVTIFDLWCDFKCCPWYFKLDFEHFAKL